MATETAEQQTTTNVAARLSAMARRMPDADAVVVQLPRLRDSHGRHVYARYTFGELDRDSDLLAAGLHDMGVPVGSRLALMVRPGFDFISLVFALFKAGVVQILIDPGMGRRNVLKCLDEAEPAGFIAEVAEMVVHEADWPSLIAHLVHSHVLTGEDGAQVDFGSCSPIRPQRVTCEQGCGDCESRTYWLASSRRLPRRVERRRTTKTEWPRLQLRTATRSHR